MSAARCAAVWAPAATSSTEALTPSVRVPREAICRAVSSTFDRTSSTPALDSSAKAERLSAVAWTAVWASRISSRASRTRARRPMKVRTSWLTSSRERIG